MRNRSSRYDEVVTLLGIDGDCFLPIFLDPTDKHSAVMLTDSLRAESPSWAHSAGQLRSMILILVNVLLKVPR